MSRKNTPFFVHELALCQSEDIGEHTKIWAFSQVMKGATVGQHCNIGSHVFIENGASVGNRVTVKNQVLLFEGVTVQDDVFIGPGVVFCNDRYPRSPRMQFEPIQERYQSRERWLAPITVKRGASLGAGSVLLPGVTIGTFALVAAHTSVTKDVPAYALWRGCPGRLAGWVCACAKPLHFDNPDQISCSCGQSYQFCNNQLCPMNDDNRLTE
ncbi:MAG: acyltransferase [Myxococcota bacterium]